MKQVLVARPTPFLAGFARIRNELGVPASFPDEVNQAAFDATPMPAERRDARDLPLIAIDPPGAADLDQAFAATAHADGFRVQYAIADVGAFVRPGGSIDTEARARGTTRYSPDLRTPLHPPILSEDRASLLPNGERPALLWTIDLDADGEPVDSHLERATVRVREAISYAEAQERIAGGDELLTPLRTIGELRHQREVARGGISLNLPTQIVVGQDGHYDVRYDRSLPVEAWNAQISLLAGIVAGQTMAAAGVGLLRTLPATSQQDLRMLRCQAKTLGIDWPRDRSYPDLIRTIEPLDSRHSAFLIQAARSLRGAGYLAVNGSLPDDHRHGAIASVYAHVTAPLRRLVDRFCNEILLALYADQPAPSWAVEALEELPTLMGRARTRESNLSTAIINYTEAMCLLDRIGQEFPAGVVDVDTERRRARIQLVEPAVVTTMDAERLDLGSDVLVRLTDADPETRTIRFEVV